MAQLGVVMTGTLPVVFGAGHVSLYARVESECTGPVSGGIRVWAFLRQSDVKQGPDPSV